MHSSRDHGIHTVLACCRLFCIDSLILEWMPSFKSLIKHFCRTRNGLSVYSHDRILCFERVRCNVKRHSTQNSQFHLSKQMGSKLTVCVWNALKWALSKGFWANFRRNNIVFAQLNANAVCSDLIKALFIEDFRLNSKIVFPSFSICLSQQSSRFSCLMHVFLFFSL